MPKTRNETRKYADKAKANKEVQERNNEEKKRGKRENATKRKGGNSEEKKNALITNSKSQKSHGKRARQRVCSTKLLWMAKSLSVLTT